MRGRKSLRRGNPSRSRLYWLFLLPSLLGVLLFFTIPFAYSLYYALIDNLGTRNFVGLQNFTDTLTNELFQSASFNTAVFMGLSIPAGMAIALLLALCLRGMKRGKVITSLLLMLPLVVPSGAIAYFWQVMFGANGQVIKLMLQLGADHREIVQNQWAMGSLVVIFLWKNISYNIVLFWSGLNWIPNTYYEQMRIEGGGAWTQFRHITWVYLAPTTIVTLLMSVANSFKVFKEVYSLYGAYPAKDIYLLQHYMNNQFLAVNMQKLSSAAYILFVVVGAALWILFKAQKKLTDYYY